MIRSAPGSERRAVREVVHSAGHARAESDPAPGAVLGFRAGGRPSRADLVQGLGDPRLERSPEKAGGSHGHVRLLERRAPDGGATPTGRSGHVLARTPRALAGGRSDPRRGAVGPPCLDGHPGHAIPFRQLWARGKLLPWLNVRVRIAREAGWRPADTAGVGSSGSRFSMPVPSAARPTSCNAVRRPRRRPCAASDPWLDPCVALCSLELGTPQLSDLQLFQGLDEYA